MKRFKLFVLLSALTLFTACDVSLDPTTFRGLEFTTEAQLDEQVAGMYNQLSQDQLFAQGLWGYFVAGNDEGFRSGIGASVVLPEAYNIPADNTNVWLFWRCLYKGIENANIIMSVANVPVMDETKRARVKGAARFLRAYYYYLLVNHFGDVPLKIQTSESLGTNFQLPRDPQKKVYDFIVSELKEAEPLLPGIQQAMTTTVVTKSAVQALLVRVYLKMAGYPLNDASKYEDALFWSKKLIDSHIHGLNQDYSKLFINNMQNNVQDNNTLEGIWDAAFLSKSNSSGAYANTAYLVTQRLGALNGIYCPDASATGVIGYSPATYRVFPKLFKLYAPGDQRRDWNIGTYSYKNTTNTRYPYLQVNFTGGGGSGASATAFTGPSGEITKIVIDNPGTGYITAPDISFTSYNNSSVALPAVPQQTVTDPAKMAAATATVSGGQVISVTVTKGGQGYPTIYDQPVAKWRREYELNLPPVRSQNNTSSNFPILRYADVLLMAAEADLKTHGAPTSFGIECFNQVRRRAFRYNPATPNAAIDVSTFTIQDLMDERARELCFEGQRYNDLIRWGQMTQAMQAVQTDNTANAPIVYLTAVNYAAANFLSNPQKYALLPIPEGERRLDKALTQNEGW
ncbi:RagB/SusD family nutrient uptake outer membrane protein [Niabella sp. CC-SYL272]|uniref:RagB/SusD family nutrient uptake outer membrane protein n=1 Tax=Niabella agricola TaxID=2891571 RepID=UPI001F412F95|nr:RagB/SusD family nutrient uptake outer membrane protein [Niabella agricola]MCF3111252.1 RagB/SusD family nutrient uptake outer membrane protein [Niabella agricola]